jgi:hypothetical protein
MDASQIVGRKSSSGGSGEGREGKEDENPTRCTLAEGETDDLPCLTRRKVARYASSGGSREDGDDDEDRDRPPCVESVSVAGETADEVVAGDRRRAPEKVGTTEDVKGIDPPSHDGGVKSDGDIRRAPEEVGTAGRVSGTQSTGCGRTGREDVEGTDPPPHEGEVKSAR